ncbi:MAG: hypothetical protein R3C99_27065 [Pirellulaceae bacterium]
MSVRFAGLALLTLGSLLTIVVAGCGSPGGGGDSQPAAGTPAASSPGDPKRVDVGTLPPVDEYLGVALDGGRLEIAPPSGWERGTRSQKYLAAFFRAKATQVPRIVITADESPYPVATVTEANVAEFAREVQKHLEQTVPGKIIEPPLPMMIGPNPFARYVLLSGQYNNVPIERQMLVTVFDGRLYELDLTVFENRIKESRDFSYAVAAAFKFHTPDSTDLGGLPATQPSAEASDAGATDAAAVPMPE